MFSLYKPKSFFNKDEVSQTNLPGKKYLLLFFFYSIDDGLVKSPFCPLYVIPAKAGIQLFQVVLDSCFRRRDGFSDFLRNCHR